MKIDLEVLSFIRDTMLSDPSTDAQFIYACTHIAEEDKELYIMLNEWMKSEGKEKEYWERDLTHRVDYLTSMKDLF